MNLKFRVFISFLALLLIGMGVSITYKSFQPSDEFRYAGKIVLQSEVEYAKFKEIVGRSDVDIEKMMVLSSEPPIVIDFVVYAPTELYFPYVEKPESDHFLLFIVPLLGIFVIVMGIYLTVHCVRNTLD